MSNTPKRYLKDLDVEFISLVDAGANMKTLMYKSARPQGDHAPDSAFTKRMAIKKTDEEKHLIYCIVYSPDEVDAHGDAMKAAQIEKAAHNFLFEGRTDQVDKQHNEQPGDGRVVESYIIGKNDTNFPDDPAGSWGVAIKVLNEDTWTEVKEGTLTGVSMQGWCMAEQVETQEKSLLKKIKELFNNQSANPFAKGNVSKDFSQRMMHKQIRQAVWAFNDEVMDQLDDDTVDDKKAAVLGTTQEFSSYISELSAQTTKQFKKTDMSKETKSKANEPDETTNGQEPSETQKAFEKALENKLDPLQKSITEQGESLANLEKRLESVEEASPGSKTTKGQDEAEEAEKTYKGIPFLGGGPSQ